MVRPKTTRLGTAVLLVALAAGVPVRAEEPGPAAAPLSRIAFGSCNDPRNPQPLWKPILATEPQLWIWLGDIVYADTEDMTRMKRLYDRQKQEIGYQALRRTCPVIGTWDDHDFGRNNAGKEYPAREKSQECLLSFLEEPRDSPRWKQEGVYASCLYGPPGRTVQVILLDTRYHRDEPGKESDILGEGQWKWLEKSLAGTDAQLRVIGSSIQVLTDEHPYEKWANFPKARARLMELLARTKAAGVVFLSGDRHLGEISKMAEGPAGYPLYDVTSSGLTHSVPETFKPAPNRYRTGPVFPQRNFGTIRIDWDAAPVLISLQVRDADGTVRIEEKMPLSALKPR